MSTEARVVEADCEVTYTASRAVRIGHCPNPECGRVLAIFNDHRPWPPAECVCGWAGDTLSLVNSVRLDSRWLVSDGSLPERELRT